MCDPVSLAIVGSAVLGAGVSYVQGQQAAKTAKNAQNQAKEAAATTAKQADQAFNKANAKTPDIGALDAANQMQAKGGVGSTMLTGAAGVDPTALTLGKTTLLGQ